VTVRLAEGGETRFVWNADTRITGVLTPGARVTVRYVAGDGGQNQALQITVARN
jgi:YD repeat-containing protein